MSNPLTVDARAKIVASLPALQRGAVWRATQVEALWDSIACGFPIGSFLLMPYQANLGSQKMLLGPQDLEPTHMLLDGQQRANSIALGYLAPWLRREPDVPAALWVDLGAPPNSERTLHARLVSRAHPWGYPVANDRQRLEASDIRSAIENFRAVDSGSEWSRKPPVCCSWPWDSWAPVPLAVLLAADDDSPASVLAKYSEMVPWWPGLVTKHQVDGKAYHEALPRILKDSRSRIAALRRVVDEYRVPAINVDLARNGMHAIGLDAGKDPAETLFLRINAGGTPLQGEDLIYSMVKAIWPDAAQLIAKLQHHLVSEPRAALMVARLALVDRKSSALPPVPEVSRFRRLVHGDSAEQAYRARLDAYLRTKAAPIFRDAAKLLTGGDYALPAVLAADLGRGEGGREILFLLLRWIERLHENRQAVSSLKPAQRRRVLGALTAISWFSRRPEGCVSVLWPRLQKCDASELENFFERKNFRHCLMGDARRREPPMLLLPSPMTLYRQVSAKVTSPRGARASGGFRDPGSAFWREWTWYGSFATLSNYLENWYRKSMARLGTIHSEDEPWRERAEADWVLFADKLSLERRLVLLAQRHYLAEWFPDFDPTHPETVEEMNRPWDMDHIHPRYFIDGRHNVPDVVRDWHASIGNLRAWPFDANRADSHTPPADKLGGRPDEVLKGYGIKTAKALRAASFVLDGQWEDFQRCTPTRPVPRYLSMAAEHGECRIALVRALTSRTVALYSAWYKDLKIETLMPSTKD
ncbi:DUF262 domain-containing protein [Variovorax paradoxus]|uniref:DUF262 domain-containing protein n=1 Tax=Variovorax paradoxus TaxID=34073 RepID=UPI00193332F7|nr:DUF262 domain-containing protein [Variovorax paradoxus]